MKYLVSVGMGLLLAGILPAADKTEKMEAFGKKLLKLMDDVAAKLGEIKDNDSADKAIPDIQKIVKQMKDLGKESKKLEPSKEEQKAFQKKFTDKIQARAKKISEAARQALKNAPDRSKKIQAALQGRK